jgi:hypothetical protein
MVFLFSSNDWCARGMKYKLGNGKVIRYWQDVWIYRRTSPQSQQNL